MLEVFASARDMGEIDEQDSEKKRRWMEMLTLMSVMKVRT